MAWWSNLDDEVYDPIGALSAGSAARPMMLTETWPEILSQHVTGPTAVLARHLATPNYEMLWFLRLARRHGFRALIVEHSSDKFTAQNPTKRALATVPIVTGRTEKGQPIVRRQRVVDLASAEGLRLDEIVTRSGERLLQYHHRKLSEVMGREAPACIDLRELLPRGEMSPAKYYREFFGMLSGHLTLFEDFVADEQTAAFFQKTVLPAWRDVVILTGRRPQIVRLSPGRRATAQLWSAYPFAVADNPDWIRRTRTRADVV